VAMATACNSPLSPTCMFSSLSKKPMYMPTANAMTCHSQRSLVLASNAHRPEIQSLVSGSQIISADLP
jgi:hypothetical protein